MSESSDLYQGDKPAFSLHKSERLHLKSDIDKLFQEGSWFSLENISVVYRKVPGNMPAIFIAVPKKHQRKAYQRVTSRRMIREAYRKNKQILIKTINDCGQNIHFAVVCKSKEALSYQQAESKIILTLQRLSKELLKA